MRIEIVTPSAPDGSRSGNAVTARRWSRILAALGHDARVAHAHDGAPADLLLALHAFRSAPSVARFREAFPDRPVVLALTGTDFNECLESDPATTLGAMRAARNLVCLHDSVAPRIPAALREKLRTIYQSVQPHRAPRETAVRHFEVCVVGNLRDVKDPLRAALAARALPGHSRVRVTHLGAAYDDAWERRARDEMLHNPRYRWLGQRPAWQVRRTLRRAHAMVISSLSEGGANVVGEAAVAGTPVLASRIEGNVGLLGGTYPGYFPAKNTAALRDLLLKSESAPDFLAALEAGVAARAPLFDPAEEQRRWGSLIDALTRQS